MPLSRKISGLALAGLGLLVVIGCVALLSVSRLFWNEALYAASGHDDVARVRACLQRGADVNYAEDLGHVTPLIEAASKGYSDVVLALLESGADPKARDWTGETAEQQAANDRTRNLLHRWVQGIRPKH